MIGSKLCRFNFSVRVRYAPSPTGPMHLGAVRTALINYLFAIKNNGKFILRIEDTDLQRNKQNGMQQIYDTLKWLHILPHQSFKNNKNHGPYVQSERIQIYKKIQKQLISSGAAYPCFCGQKKQQNNDNFYDGKCRNLQMQQIIQRMKNGQKHVVRIKSGFSQLRVQSFEDKVFGNVAATPFDDFVIVKSNGWPTYHFANVIDDWQMDITHVIRGAQWLTNTSKHIYLYNILGVKKIPIFMHLPLILSPEGKKLSKRDPTAPINSLKQKGYLSEAIVNYAGLLGLNPKTPLKKEFFTLKQLSQIFQPEQLNSSPIKSDTKKLNFFNRHYIRQKWKNKNQDFISKACKKLRQQHNLDKKQFDQQYLRQVVSCVIERVNNLEEFSQFPYFFKKMQFQDQQAVKDIKKLFGKQTEVSITNNSLSISNYDSQLYQKNQKILNNLLLIFQHVVTPQEYNETNIAKSISQYLYDNSNILKNEDVYHLLRLAVIGRRSGPNIVKICCLFGKQRVIDSLKGLKNILDANQKLGLSDDHI